MVWTWCWTGNYHRPEFPVFPLKWRSYLSLCVCQTWPQSGHTPRMWHEAVWLPMLTLCRRDSEMRHGILWTVFSQCTGLMQDESTASLSKRTHTHTHKHTHVHIALLEHTSNKYFRINTIVLTLRSKPDLAWCFASEHFFPICCFEQLV